MATKRVVVCDIFFCFFLWVGVCAGEGGGEMRWERIMLIMFI